MGDHSIWRNVSSGSRFAVKSHPNPAKVLVVIGTLDSGGCERHLLSVLPVLDRAQFNVSVFTLTKRGALADEMQNRGISVSAPKKRALDGRRFRMQWLTNMFAISWAFNAHLRTYRPHIVHFFLPGAYVIGAPICLFARQERLAMSRRSLSNYQNKHQISACVERFLHPRMSCILGNSRAVVEQLRAECPSHDSVQLLYNGIEVNDLPSVAERRRLRDQLGIDDETVALGILANLIPYKGHADLLQACGRVNPKNSDWKLFVIGRDDGIGTKLQALAESLGLEDRVCFVGERPDARSLLGAMDIGVSASHEEGFSNAILEFMAAGVPVVATDAGGNAEAVVDGTTGFVVPVADPGRMAEALTRLIEDGALRERMGIAGNRIVREKFSISTCVSGYENVYRRLMGLPQPGLRG